MAGEVEALRKVQAVAIAEQMALDEASLQRLEAEKAKNKVSFSTLLYLSVSTTTLRLTLGMCMFCGACILRWLEGAASLSLKINRVCIYEAQHFQSSVEIVVCIGRTCCLP